jgi:hypothetical protein
MHLLADPVAELGILDHTIIVGTDIPKDAFGAIISIDVAGRAPSLSFASINLTRHD